MKSLAEEVNEIKNMSASRMAKKEALIKLGLREHEVNLLIGQITSPVTHRESAFTFGVEIECLIGRGAITSSLQENGVSFQYEGYNHRDNAESYFRHQTIEFRQHQGSTDFEKISNWVNFCAKLVEYSKTNAIDHCNSIDDIPFLNESEKRFFNQRRAALN